jgi:hypothetical protein
MQMIKAGSLRASGLSAPELQVAIKPSDWHHLSLQMQGDLITGFVDGNKLASISNKLGSKGMAFIASTYNHNLFDNIHIELRFPIKNGK